MIDFRIFEDEWQLLEACFGPVLKTTDEQSRRLRQQLIGEAHQFLSEHLSSEEFVESCQRLRLEEDRFARFPSPQRIVDKVKGSLDDRAVAFWDLIQQMQELDYSQLCPEALAALESIGGFNFLKTGDGVDVQRSYLRRDFVVSFKVWSTPVRQRSAMMQVYRDRISRKALPTASQGQPRMDDFVPELDLNSPSTIEAIAKARLIVQQSANHPRSSCFSAIADINPKALSLSEELVQKNSWLSDRILRSEAIEWAFNHPDVLIESDESGAPVRFAEAKHVEREKKAS